MRPSHWFPFGWPDGWIQRDWSLDIIVRRFAKRILHVLRNDRKVMSVKSLRHFQHCCLGDLSGLNTRPIVPGSSRIISAMALGRMLEVTTIAKQSREQGTSRNKWFSFKEDRIYNLLNSFHEHHDVA